MFVFLVLNVMRLQKPFICWILLR